MSAVPPKQTLVSASRGSSEWADLFYLFVAQRCCLTPTGAPGSSFYCFKCVIGLSTDPDISCKITTLFYTIVSHCWCSALQLVVLQLHFLLSFFPNYLNFSHFFFLLSVCRLNELHQLKQAPSRVGTHTNTHTTSADLFFISHKALGWGSLAPDSYLNPQAVSQQVRDRNRESCRGR